MSYLPKDPHGCPYLFLAPMEGVGDKTFRKAISLIGGFDEAITEFMRVPTNAHVASLAKKYNHLEIHPFPLTPQIMGGDAHLMAKMAQELEKRQAKKIDINCGCPSNKVTRRGAGSTLLKNPELLHKICSSVVKAVSIPVSVKMRSGFSDNTLFQENLLAIQESGVKYITLHPRTKIQGYRSKANWELIKEAKALLQIPVVGNGDIVTVQDALSILSTTNCDALMIGRGALIDPFIFLKIRSFFSKKEESLSWDFLHSFLLSYLEQISHLRAKSQINKLKQLFNMLFQMPSLLSFRQKVLTCTLKDPIKFFDYSMAFLQANWSNKKDL